MNKKSSYQITNSTTYNFGNNNDRHTHTQQGNRKREECKERTAKLLLFSCHVSWDWKSQALKSCEVEKNLIWFYHNDEDEETYFGYLKKCIHNTYLHEYTYLIPIHKLDNSLLQNPSNLQLNLDFWYVCLSGWKVVDGNNSNK